MKFYGYINLNDLSVSSVRREHLECFSRWGVTSAHVIDPFVDGRTSHVYEWLKSEGVTDIVIGFRDRVHKPSASTDLERIKRAKDITPRLALGTSSLHEWGGTVEVARIFYDFSQKHGFEWVCTLVVSNLPRLIQNGGDFRDFMATTGTELHCLCGYVFIGWENKIDPLFVGVRCVQANRMMPHKVESGSMDWYTKERFTEWMRPLNIMTGCSYQLGLDNGVVDLAPSLGFKGLICGTPFDLSKTLEHTT